MTFLEKVKKLGKEQKKSIKSLEQYCGISKGAVYKWSSSKPSYETVVKCAEFFNVPISYFTDDDAEPVPLDAKAILDQLIFSLGADAPVNFSVDEMPEDERAILQQGLQAALDKHKLYKELKENWQNENQ